MRLALLTTVAIVALAVPATSLAGPEPDESGAAAAPPELAPLLERAGRYALEYERDFPDIGADEAYTQWTRPGDTHPLVTTVEGSVPAEVPAVSCYASTAAEERGGIAVQPWCQRNTKAEAVFVRSARGGVRSFRDVYEVERMNVRKPDKRLERLFSSLPAAEAERQGRGLLEASDARYCIGPCMRDLNAPTLGLVVLQPENQSRFTWTPAGKRKLESVDTVEVAFEEAARPTLLRQSDGEPLPISGRLWIDAARGTLVRSELEFRFAPRWARALVAVDYRQDPVLGIWVPAERREQYEDLPGGQPMFGRPTKATAKFSGFHRLERAAAAAAVVPPAYGPELVQALQRAGDYVAEYERSFSDLLVEETYTQQTVAPVRTKIDERGRAVMTACSNCKRKTRAELVFVRLAGEFPWASYRDVFEVDGSRLREPDQRLVKLLSTPQPDAQREGQQPVEGERRLQHRSGEAHCEPADPASGLPHADEPAPLRVPARRAQDDRRDGHRRAPVPGDVAADAGQGAEMARTCPRAAASG